MYQSYKFRIYPNETQKALIMKTFGCCRFIYNKMLEDRVAHYNETKQQMKCYPSMYRSKYPFLAEVDSHALVEAQNALDKAFRNFAAKNCEFPVPKSRNDSNNFSFSSSRVQLVDGRLRLPKIKDININLHREIPSGAKLKLVTISLQPNGEYYASLLVDDGFKAIPVEAKSFVGLDLSFNKVYVASDGSVPDYPYYYVESMATLQKKRRALSRCKHGSKNHEKERIKLAKLNQHIHNQRMDFLHKTSNALVAKYDCIAVEDINLPDVTSKKNLKLIFNDSTPEAIRGIQAKVKDGSFGTLKLMLQYKLERQGKELITIGRYYPSSQTCCCCGNVNKELTLNERIYKCDKCGHELDRDINAAINISEEGKRIYFQK